MNDPIKPITREGVECFHKALVKREEYGVITLGNELAGSTIALIEKVMPLVEILVLMDCECSFMSDVLQEPCLVCAPTKSRRIIMDEVTEIQLSYLKECYIDGILHPEGSRHNMVNGKLIRRNVCERLVLKGLLNFVGSATYTGNEPQYTLSDAGRSLIGEPNDAKT